MGTKSKSFALVIVALFLTSLVTLQPVSVEAQSTTMTSAPSIEWQQEYGNYYTEFVSNLIQTIDGGYAFLDLGWNHGFTLAPSTLYKTDSLGNIQWQKHFDYFTAINLIQTSDKGFEISGNWNTYGTTYQTTPTLIKTDSAGNIQWAQNYTSQPPNLNIPSNEIPTDDGGIISLQSTGSIIKTDSNGTSQWQLNGTFAYGNFKTPIIHLSSLIEASDGAIAALGVGTPYSHTAYEGNLFLVKTEPFLPKPSSVALPTPLPTPIVIGNSVLTLVIITVVVIIAFVIFLLIFRRHRKPIKLS